MSLFEKSFRTIRTRGVTLSKDQMENFRIRKIFNSMGDLEINGSPRWRQRAFYDYLRDVFAMIYRIPVVRISIYDKIIVNDQIKSVGTILLDGNISDLNEIVKFIEQKINSGR